MNWVIKNKINSVFDLKEYKELHIKDIETIIELSKIDFLNMFNKDNLVNYKLFSQHKVEFEWNIKNFLKLKWWFFDTSDLISFYFKVVSFEIYRQQKYFNKTQNIELLFNNLVWVKQKSKKLINIELLSKKSKINKEKEYDYKSNVDPFNVLKKVYSSSPYINYSNFDKLPLHKQISSLYEEKKTNNLVSDNLKWWSCHNWSIIYSNILNLLWIKSRFIVFWVHSFLIFSYKWKWYYFDTNHNVKFYPQPLENWTKIDIWDGEFWTVKKIYPNFVVENNNCLKKSNKNFRSKDRFVNYLDKKKKKNILVEYNSLDETWKKTFKLEIYILNWKLNIIISYLDNDGTWIYKKEIKYKNYKISNFILRMKKEGITFTTKSILFEIFKRTKHLKLKDDTIILWMLKVINPSWLEEIILNNIDIKKKC